jgi:ankyrin repeat protein
LFIACAHGQLDIMRYFINNQWPTSSGTDDNLYLIAYVNVREDVIDLLTERHSVHVWDNGFARYANAYLLDKLFKAGLRMNEDGKKSAIMSFLEGPRVNESEPMEMIDLLIANGATLRTDDKFKSVLTISIINGFNSLIQPLLDRDITLLNQGTVGFSPLDRAISDNNEEAVAILISNISRLPIGLRDHIISARYLVGDCIMKKRYHMIRVIMANVSMNPRELDSSFCVAIEKAHQNYEVLEILIQGGVNPNDVINTTVAGGTALGYNALMCAVDADNLDIVKLLMENGADPNAIPRQLTTINAQVNESAFSLACRGGKMEIIKYMYNVGIEITVLAARHILVLPNILFWMLMHPTRPLNENMGFDYADEHYSLIDIALLDGFAPAIRILKGFGAQFLKYNPQEVREMEEHLEMNNSEIES